MNSWKDMDVTEQNEEPQTPKFHLFFSYKSNRKLQSTSMKLFPSLKAKPHHYLPSKTRLLLQISTVKPTLEF